MNQPVITRQPVTSSNIESVGYDSASHTLEVCFSGGSVYRYYGVGATIFEAFKTVESPGKFFANSIKGWYECEKVGEPAATSKIDRNFEQQLQRIREIDDEIKQLTEDNANRRARLMRWLQEGNLTTYRGTAATVAIVERKSVKVTDEAQAIQCAALHEVSLDVLAPRYIQSIPAHFELTDTYLKDVKAGAIENPAGVEVTTSTSLRIEFVKGGE